MTMVGRVLYFYEKNFSTITTENYSVCFKCVAQKNIHSVILKGYKPWLSFDSETSVILRPKLIPIQKVNKNL